MAIIVGSRAWRKQERRASRKRMYLHVMDKVEQAIVGLQGLHNVSPTHIKNVKACRSHLFKRLRPLRDVVLS